MTLLSSESVSQVTREIWAALLAGDGRPDLVPGQLPGSEIVATADISGEWNGTVCLSCSALAARHATAAMFAISDDELTSNDIVDAIGELVNVVGGNIKSMVPGPSVLSLPRVSEGTDAALPQHLELAQEVRFAWMEEPVVVSIWTTTAFTP
ncbi:MAG TPA: chemotaxis protein CheX [Acidimicrobiales bacterium]|nr:chemotaxis protein CheX [Acidimicrobiales bacterium]